jgi:hypothetical protein
LGGALESTAVGPYVPETLPLRERTQFGLSGKFSKKVAESELTLSGAYTMDGGALPTRLGIEAQPIRLQGTVSLNRDGVLLDGVVSSNLEPETIFDSGAHIRAFVPFREDASSGYAMVDGSVKAPAARLGAEAGAQIGEDGYALSGKLTTPLTNGKIAGEVSGDLPNVAGAVGPVVEKAADTVGTSVGKAAGAVGSAAGKAAENVGSAVGSAAGAVGTTVGQAAGAVGGTASKAASLVGPAVGKAAGTVGGAARQGYGLAEIFTESLINAGKARLGRNATPTPTPTPTPTAP